MDLLFVSAPLASALVQPDLVLPEELMPSLGTAGEDLEALRPGEARRGETTFIFMGVPSAKVGTGGSSEGGAGAELSTGSVSRRDSPQAPRRASSQAGSST